MSETATALLVTADEALGGELARLLMGRDLALQVVGTKSTELDVGGAELVFVDVSTDFGLSFVSSLAEQYVAESAPQSSVVELDESTSSSSHDS